MPYSNQKPVVIFFSTKTYPPTTADHFYVCDFSKSMSKIEGIEYHLILNRKGTFDFEGTNCIELNLVKNKFLKSTLLQLLYKVPSLLIRLKNKKIVFITNDKFVGIILSLWNKILFQKHCIVGDWHHKSSPLLDLPFTYSCDKHIFISAGMKKYVTKITKNNSVTNSLVSPMGVNPITFDIEASKEASRSTLNLPADKKIFGYFGRFTTFGQEKGIRICLEALQNLPHEYIFVAAGATDEDLVTYTNIAKELQVSDRALLFGTKQQKELALFQKACDILVAPYPNTPHYAHDMSPMKLFEYMVAKRPIVASRLDSMTSIITDGIFYFEPDNVSDFVKQLLEGSMFDQDSDIVLSVYNKAFTFSWDSKAKQITSFLKT